MYLFYDIYKIYLYKNRVLNSTAGGVRHWSSYTNIAVFIKFWQIIQITESFRCKKIRLRLREEQYAGLLKLLSCQCDVILGYLEVSKAAWIDYERIWELFYQWILLYIL